MTTLFYAPSTGGFYNSDVNGENIPSDAIEITEEQYGALLAGGNSGQVIVVVNGAPTLTTPTISVAQAAVNAGNAALAAGIVIISTSTPELDGTYGLDEISQNNINAVSTYILQNNTFPQGLSTTYWADQAGSIHQFPNVTVFKAFATAVANLVDTIEDYMYSGGTVSAIPSNEVTIP